MPKIIGAILVLWICGLLTAMGADSYSLADGTTISGDVVSFNDNGVILRTGPDTYTDRLPWLKFSQAGLEQFAQDPKIKPFVDPFIEPPPPQNAKPQVQVNEVQRLAQPASGSLFGALFTSSVGLVMVLLIYGANIFAGYEIAVFRARPVGMGVALAAVLPVLGPIILLSMPTLPQAAPPQEEIQAAAPAAEPEAHRFSVPQVEAGASESETERTSAPPREEIHIVASGFSGAPPPKDESSQTEIFQRGQFMFNRRFFETKFPAFFSIARSEADRGKILLVKTTGALLTVERIARIGANEVHFEVLQGGERQEIMVPFADIQQIQLKYKS